MKGLSTLIFKIALALALIAPAVVGAGCGDQPSATITITTGEELDAFSRAPAPTTLVVEYVTLDGRVTEFARTSLPAEELSLGDHGRGDVGAFRVTATDAAGAKLLKGESLFVQFGALQTASFEVFVQRAGELARLPRPPQQLDAPQVSTAVGRYIVAASGTSTFIYDLMSLTVAPPLPIPRPAKSLATIGSVVLVVDENGATSIDLSTGTKQELTPAKGGTFAEIAGGQTVNAVDSSRYIVGGTRSAGGASPRVLSVSSDGSVTFAALATAREGACATWVEGRGVVVYGGGGPSDPAVETLAPRTTVAQKLPFSPDAVKGCGATTLDDSHVLVVGGVGSPTDMNGTAQARVIDLACASSCSPTPWPGSLPLARADVLTLAPDAALAVGDDASGASRVFRLSASAPPKEIPLKVPRRGARLVALPVTGTFAIVGGAPTIEQYVE